MGGRNWMNGFHYKYIAEKKQRTKTAPDVEEKKDIVSLSREVSIYGIDKIGETSEGRKRLDELFPQRLN